MSAQHQVPRGVDGLVQVVQALSLARDVATVQDIVRRAARALTGADGATFVLRDVDKCYYADEDAIEPLWKGQRFPLEACISGWSMLNRRSVAIPDIYVDDRIPHEAYRPTFVKSLVMVPIRSADPLGAIGNYWAESHVPTDEEVQLLQALADSAAVAMVHVQILEDLERQVAERTEEVRRLSVTDELTGVLNRRGWLQSADLARAVAARSEHPSVLLFIDIDGLKRVNDDHGHKAGDALIRDTAQLLTAAVRDVDVVGRWGGDELVVLLPACDDAATTVERLHEAAAGRGISFSVGAAVIAPDAEGGVEAALSHADQQMYADKAARRALSATTGRVPRQAAQPDGESLSARGA